MKSVDDSNYPILPQHEKFYDPNYFYEHGMNPAWKNFMKIASENIRGGSPQDYRTLITRKKRYFMARNLEDFYERDLQAITFLRAGFVFMGATAALFRGLASQPSFALPYQLFAFGPKWNHQDLANSIIPNIWAPGSCWSPLDDFWRFIP